MTFQWHANDFCGYLTLDALYFFDVNVNVLKRTSLQVLWKMLQTLKDWWRVVLSSINMKKWFLNYMRVILVLKIKTSWYLKRKINMESKDFQNVLAYVFLSPWSSAQYFNPEQLSFSPSTKVFWISSCE